MPMSDKPLPTQPLSGRESVLKEKFSESIAAQNEQMDKLGQQLITLELAIPGLYATVLKLISGDKATVALTPVLYLTFACWFVALLLTLISLIPKKWEVDPGIMKQGPTKKSKTLGIEDFFYKTAQYKRRLLIASSLLFFAGVVSAAFTIF
jgi:hypothetical protein